MVAIVVQELIAPEMCDMIAAISPAITKPTRPCGRRFDQRGKHQVALFQIREDQRSHQPGQQVDKAA